MSEKSAERQRNSNLDVARGLAVIFVVFIHIQFPGKLGIIGSDLGCLCNALFFLVAGFFSLHNTNKKLLKKASKSLGIVLISYLLYAILYRDSIATIVLGIPNIIIGNVNRCGNLWFAVALVYCYALYFLLGKTHIKYVLIFGLIISILYSMYCPATYKQIFNTLFYGIPLFFLGNYIAEKKGISVCGGGYKLFVCGIILGLLLNFANLMDGVFATRLHKVGLLIYAFSTFAEAIFTPKICCENIVFRIINLIGRKYYLYFYVLQYITIDVVQKYSYMLCRDEHIDYILPFMVLIMLFVESVVLENILSFLRTNLHRIKLQKE